MPRSEGRSEDASESRDESFVGRTIGKYTLARVIGKGGMGVVYEALNTAIGKRVAIKLVSSDLSKNTDAVRRFQREAQAASAVESAHIVDIFDAGVSDDGVPYIVMELLRGEDLGHRIKRLGRLDLDDALHITVQILRGLARAHTAGIVHRDLKPDNVFLVDRDDDSTFVKVLDFGISKVARTGQTPVQTLTKQGTVLGTPFYMSPEQAQGLPDTDGRADLWSVGAILYECLTGRAPHTGASYEQVIVHICTKDADDVRMHNPGVPEGVAQVIARALEREREDRFENAREFLEVLNAASNGTLVLSRSSDEPSSPDGNGRTSGGVSSSGSRSGSGSGARSSGSGARSSGSGARSSGSGARSSGSGARSSGSGAKISSGDAARASSGSGPGYDDTVELFKGGGPSRVGWATNGGTAVARDRKRLVAVALGALVLGVIATAAVALRNPQEVAARGADGDTGTTHNVEVTVRLRANAPNARFTVDGKQVAGGLLRGTPGDTKKVVVEADGYAPVEALVALELDREPAEVLLSPRIADAANVLSAQPVVPSAAVPSAVVPSAVVPSAVVPSAVVPSAAVPSAVVQSQSVAPVDPVLKPSGKPTGTKLGPLASTKPSSGLSASPSVAPSVTPVAVVTAAPATTPTLKIKRD